MTNFSSSKKTVWFYLFAFLYGILAFSNFSYEILCVWIPMPFFFYDVFFIPFLIAFRREIWAMLKKGAYRYEWLGYAVCFLCFLIGAVRGREYLTAHLTTFRTVFYFMVGVFFFTKVEKPDMNFLYALCLGACFGDAVFLQYAAYGADYMSVNMVSLLLICIIPIMQDKLLFTVPSAFFAVYLAFRSSFRAYFVALAAALFFSLVYMVWAKRSKKALYALLTVAAGMVVAIWQIDAISAFAKDVLGMNSLAVYRVTDRLKSLVSLDFTKSEDVARLTLLKEPFETFFTAVLPQGLIRKGVDELAYGRYKDTPMTFLYDAFGSVLAWALVLFLAAHLVFLIRKHWNKDAPAEKGAAFALIMSFGVMMFVNGTFFYIVYESALAAVMVGVLLRGSPLEGKGKCRIGFAEIKAFLNKRRAE
ncbi:MAG: hypothetical protein MJ078_00610 [Clostridia bacterium]|nr:hypothetical protein [Clostridia bacterium]